MHWCAHLLVLRFHGVVNKIDEFFLSKFFHATLLFHREAALFHSRRGVRIGTPDSHTTIPYPDLSPGHRLEITTKKSFFCFRPSTTMSAFQRRNRKAATTTDLSGNDGIRGGRGSCFAIACGSSSASGIYFSREEAKRKITAIRESSHDHDVDFAGFNKIKDAEEFLNERGFAPAIPSGGWISARDKSPILYVRTENVQSRKQQGRVAPVTPHSPDKRPEANHPSGLWSNHGNGMEKQEPSPSPPDPKRRKLGREQPGDDSSTTSFVHVGGADPSDTLSNPSANPSANPSEVSPSPTAPEFDRIQQQAIDSAMAGKNVFLTGVAGTGKSLVTKVRITRAEWNGTEPRRPG